MSPKFKSIPLLFCTFVAVSASAQTYAVGGSGKPQKQGKTPPASGAQQGPGSFGTSIGVARLSRGADDALKHGNPALAATYAKQATEAAPGNAQLWFLYGYASRLANRLGESEQAYQRGLKLTPGAPDGLSGLAQTYEKQGRTDDAKRLLLQVVNSRSARVNDLLIAGELFMRTNDQQRGLEILQRAEARQPSAHSELLMAIFVVIMVVLTVALIAGSTISSAPRENVSNAEASVHAFYDHIKAHDLDAAYAMLSPGTNTSKEDFARAVFGSNGSLKTLAQMQNVETRVLHSDGNQAMVRASTTWASAIGALHESRDLKVVKSNGNNWQIVYPVAKAPDLPPQVLPVNYLRWDIIHGSGGDDWGAQNVEAPHVRITSMNAVASAGGTIILGEVVNEDTVPAFVSINATLTDNNNQEIGQESSFDKIEHVLLPKEVTPFRIDFPNVQKENVANVTLNPASLLVPASADPVIGVMHQQITKNEAGHSVLTGDLFNESGQLVNIPQVLATYYDNGGKVIWVSDAYVDHALQPQLPQPFSTGLSDDLAGQVHSFRVVVNHYNINSGGA